MAPPAQTASPVAPGRRGEAGFSLVALIASITIMLILMGAAVPTWRYVMQNAREEELIFRGTQIVDAIERYQRKNGGAAPVSMEVLVEGKYLRRHYKDPMTKVGEWRLIHPGEGVPMGPLPPGRSRGPSPSPSASPSPSPTPSPSPGTLPGRSLGAFLGVASTSTEKSLRVFNGRTRYHQWIFAVGQPRAIGKDPGVQAMPLPGGTRPPENPAPTR